MADKLRVDLTGAPQTMLATLYAKALDAERPDSVLRDRFARDAVDRIDYDWAETTITARTAPGVTARSAHFDRWTRQFLAVHPRAVVLHLGSGLDSRVLRVDPGPDVEWFDVDYPDVAALREQCYPARAHHHVVAASVTDPSWLARVPTDRPTLVLAEGVSMYLTEADGLALLRRVVATFPSGELQFDSFNRLGIRSGWTNAIVRRSGSTLHWAVDRPADILDAVPGTRLLAWQPVFQTDAFDRLPRPYRVLAAVLGRVPGVRTMAQYHRYAF